MKRICAAFVYLVLVLVVQGRALAEPLRVGAILPLSGDSAVWGENPRRAMEFALDDLPNGRDAIQVIYEDDRCDPKQAVSAFHKLTEIDGVKVILGPSCSSCAAAVSALAQNKDVLLIFFAEASSVPMTGKQLRLWIPNDRQGRALAEYLAGNRKLNKVSVLNVENAYGVDVHKAFTERLEQLGGQVVEHSTYAPESSDMRAQLLRIKNGPADALFFASYVKDGAIILKQARALGMTKPMFGVSTINTPEFIKLAGKLAEGVVLLDVVDVTSGAFRARWVERYKEEWPGLQSGAPLFYDLVFLLNEAALAHKSEPEELKQAFLSRARYNGVSGSFKFAPDGNMELSLTRLRIKDGKFVPDEQ